MKKRNILIASGLTLGVIAGATFGKIPLNVMNDRYVEKNLILESYIKTNIEKQSENKDKMILVWENLDKMDCGVLYNYIGAITVEDGIIAVGASGEVVKYDFNGNLVWENLDKIEYSLYDVISLEDGIIAVGCNEEIVKYDFNGNVVWDNTYSYDREATYNGVTKVVDGIIVVGYDRLGGLIKKYDFNGNLVWKKNRLHNESYYGVTALEDGFVAVGENGNLIRYDFDGNLVWEQEKIGITNQYYKKVIKIEDGIVAVGTHEIITKYDFNGNIVWEQDQKFSSNNYYGVTALEDGFVAVGENGNLIRYDFDGNMIWKEDIIVNRNYNGVTKVEDGIILVGGNGEIIKYGYNVDKTALNKLLDDVSKLKEKDYTQSTWQALQDAISGADSLTTQEEIDAKVTEIQTAIDNLVLADVDKSKLDELLKDIEKLEEGDYTPESWDNLQDKLNGLDDLNKQSDVDNKVKEIEDAIKELVIVEPNRTELDKILGEVDKLNESDYSKETWKNLQDALTGTDDLPKQSDVDKKVAEIQNAINNLDVDRSALDKLLDDVSKLKEKDYTSSTWQALQDAINGADSLTKQSEIDSKVTEIQTAIDNLELVEVDKSKLDELLKDIEKLEEGDYTPESWDNLQDKLNGLDDLNKQSDVDDKVKEIEDAINDLVIVEPNRTELDKILGEVDKLNESDYSKETWKNLQDALTGTDDLPKQSDVDKKVAEIQTAIDNLNVDRSALNKLLEDVSKLTETDYSSASWEELQNAITGADTLTKQREIDSKVAEIQTALDNLGVDTSVLDKLLENISKLNETDYSSTSWEELQNAIKGADTLTKQSKIDSKVAEIQAAISNLGIDRSKLDDLIAEVDRLVSTDYSTESWNKLQGAISNASTVITQAQVENAIKEITNAKNNLGVDRSELDRLIEESSKLNEKDYSSNSWKTLQDTLAGTDNLTKQSEINSKVTEIQSAINNLTIDTTKLVELLDRIDKMNKDVYTKDSLDNLMKVVDSVEECTKQYEVDEKVAELEESLKNLKLDPDKVQIQKGDLDKNGIVNANDAAIALDLYKYGNVSDEELLIGDMDNNGIINANDAALILDIYKYGK